MKTITKASAEKKLQKLVDQKMINKSSIVYEWMQKLINGQKQFRPVYSQGSSWNHSSLFDRRVEFTSILNRMGIEYEQGNDAPRGGKTGAFVNITTKVVK